MTIEASRAEIGREVRLKPAPYLATVAVFTLSGVIPILLWSFGPTSAGTPTAEGLLTAVLVVSGARFAWVLGSPVRRLHEMVVWLFTYLFLGVAPFVQLRSKFPGTTPGLDGNWATAAAGIVLVGACAIIIGSWWAGHSSPKQKPARERPALVTAGRVYLLTAIAAGLAAYYVVQIGPASLFASRLNVGSARAETFGGPIGTLLLAGAKMGLLVAFVALVQLCRQRKALGTHRPIVLTIATLCLLLAIVNPISSARYVFGTVALAVIGALGVYSTIRRFRITAIAALVGMVVAFPILDTFRRTLDATVQLESPVDSLTTGDFDAFAQIMNTYQYVGSRGVALGMQMLGVVFFWVPRDLWPDKPLDTGTVLADFQGYRFQNLSAPLWAELYINAGWIGLVVGMVGFGFLIRRLDERSEAMLSLYGTPGIAATIIPFYLLIVLRGSLLQAMSNLLIILVAAWFVTRQPREQRAPKPRSALVHGTVAETP